jgi:hypothetical protein
MSQVNTRGGVFSPSGYGGGIFNQNVAFGAVEAGPRPMLHPLAGGTWGAIPWYCWGGASGLPVNQPFRDCVAAHQAANPGLSLENPAFVAAVQSGCSQYCDELAASTQVYGGSYSADTANLQSRINAHIHASRAQDPAFKYCPVEVDGVIGKETCTASRVLFGQFPDICNSKGFDSPWQSKDCGGGHDVPPAPPPVIVLDTPPTLPPTQPPTTKKAAAYSSASMMVGGVIAAAVLGGLAWYGSEQGWFSKK